MSTNKDAKSTSMDAYKSPPTSPDRRAVVPASSSSSDTSTSPPTPECLLGEDIVDNLKEEYLLDPEFLFPNLVTDCDHHTAFREPLVDEGLRCELYAVCK